MSLAIIFKFRIFAIFLYAVSSSIISHLRLRDRNVFSSASEKATVPWATLITSLDYFHDFFFLMKWQNAIPSFCFSMHFDKIFTQQITSSILKKTNYIYFTSWSRNSKNEWMPFDCLFSELASLLRHSACITNRIWISIHTWRILELKKTL